MYSGCFARTRGEHTMAYIHDAGVKRLTPILGDIQIFLTMSVKNWPLY